MVTVTNLDFSIFLFFWTEEQTDQQITENNQ